MYPIPDHIKELMAEILKNTKKSIPKNKYKKYGMTLEDYDKMFVAQNGQCAICQKHQSELKHTLVVDHNHKTGKIRGLLCNRCNTLLGHIEHDRGEWEIRALEYITREE